ncbi:RNA polymerase sigma factor [Luteolibacter sp. Populi]|uniref:RNA polymerase sigma factor n=1 Tax=Luteolibacter sp. Populi TaxID=3230487 RepID=UPI0034667F18
MKDTDGQLLQSFATDRDEDAFRLLAKRHLGLVFHTALRRTGNRPLAEEICQNVLLAMARKSGTLAKEPGCLPGWLHRATLYEASKAMRAESSYQRRKQQGQDETAADADANFTDPAWCEALPHLDLALDKLPEADRRIILLHYFEGHPFPRIAERLGKNLTAIQKQSQRALEKLSRILRTKGIALSVTALGAGLATQTAKAVPEALVHSASSFAIAGSTTPFAFSLTAMLASKSKVIVPLALLLLASPLVLQQFAIAGERTRLQSLRDSLVLSNKTSGSGDSRNALHASTATTSGSLDIMVLAKEQADAERIGGETQRRFYAKLKALDKDTLASLIRKTGAAPLGKEKKVHLTGALLATISESDPGLGVAAAVAGLPEGPVLADIIFETGVDTTLSGWAGKDPAAAIAWFRGAKDLPKLNSRPSNFTGLDSPNGRERLETYLVHGLIISTASHAASYLGDLPEAERLQLIEKTIQNLCLANMRDALPGDWLAPYLQIVRDIVPREEQEQMVAKLGSGTDWKSLTQVLAGAGASPTETATLARSVVQMEFGRSRMNRWHYGNPVPLDPGIIGCLEELVPGRGQEIIAEARTAADRAGFQEAADLLTKVRAGSALPESHVFWMLTGQTDLSSHFAEALELAGRIENPELRQETINRLNAKAKVYSAP